MPTKSSREYLTLPAAARALGLPVNMLRRAAKAGKFPTYCVGGPRLRVLLSEVRAWIDSGRSIPSTAKASVHAEAVVGSVLARETESETLRDRHCPAISPGQENSK